MSEIKKRDLGFYIYLAARVIKAIASIYLIRVLVTVLSVSEYGEWKYLEVMGGMLIPVLTLSLPAAMMRMFYERSSTDETRAVLVNTVWRISCVMSLLVLFFCFSLGALFLDMKAQLFFGLVTPAVILVSFFDYLSRVKKNTQIYFANRMIESFGFVVALFLFDLSFSSGGKLGLSYIVSAWALCVWGIILTNTYYYSRQGVLSFDVEMLGWGDVRALFKFSAPLSGTYFLGWMLNSSDIYLLKELSTQREVAYYAFAVGFASFVGLITQAALTDWAPFFYARRRVSEGETHLADISDIQRQIIKRALFYLGLHVLMILGARLVAGFGYQLFNAHDYMPGVSFIGVLALGNFFFLMGNLCAVGLGYVKKTHLTLVTFLVPGLLNLFLNLYYIPLYGALAAAWTTAISFGLFAVLSYAMSRRYYRFEHEWGLLLVSAVAVIVALY